jgi:hypothetical protein
MEDSKNYESRIVHLVERPIQREKSNLGLNAWELYGGGGNATHDSVQTEDGRYANKLNDS